jgi:hypothetical protein
VKFGPLSTLSPQSGCLVGVTFVAGEGMAGSSACGAEDVGRWCATSGPEHPVRHPLSSQPGASGRIHLTIIGRAAGIR